MRKNWIYSKTRDNKARFLLGEKGHRTLVCIGINPSTATPEKLDRTLQCVKRFSSDLGYDSWLMLNVYPQRSTNPDKLHTKLNAAYHSKNLKNIRSILRTGRFDIWAAWGTIIKRRDYLFSCLHDIVSSTKTRSFTWYTMGRKCAGGHPHHPLYLKRDSRLEPFDVDDYLAKFH